MNICKKCESECLVIEPFYGGSHKQLITTIMEHFGIRCKLFTLLPGKWHWRSRCSAVHFAQTLPVIEKGTTVKTLFCSSVLNLSELVSLRSDLAVLRKVVYFHENQLAYPKQEIKQRDFQYPYNQVLTCLVADVIAFNSKYNFDSFLENLRFLNIMPADQRPNIDLIKEQIIKKSIVLYFPMNIEYDVSMSRVSNDGGLTIVWPHRWEHDKNPESFFDVMIKLKQNNFAFRLIVLGESYNEKPDVFQTAFDALEGHILHWGYCEEKIKYFELLNLSDVVVSTANHEFFGVSMLEAISHGCLPLAPDRLVYPEILPSECLYKSDGQLYKRLVEYCKKPNLVTEQFRRIDFNLERFSIQNLKDNYRHLILGMRDS